MPVADVQNLVFSSFGFSDQLSLQEWSLQIRPGRFWKWLLKGPHSFHSSDSS